MFGRCKGLEGGIHQWVKLAGCISLAVVAAHTGRRLRHASWFRKLVYNAHDRSLIIPKAAASAGEQCYLETPTDTAVSRFETDWPSARPKVHTG